MKPPYTGWGGNAREPHSAIVRVQVYRSRCEALQWHRSLCLARWSGYVKALVIA